MLLMEDFIPASGGNKTESKEKRVFAIEEIREILKTIDGKERPNLFIEETIKNIKGEEMAIVFTDNEKETDREGKESAISYLLTLPGQRYKSDGTLGRVVYDPFLTKDYNGGDYSEMLAVYKEGGWTKC